MSGRIKIGDAILLSNNRCGIVRYYGKTRFSVGYWFGVQLTDLTLTRHNGMVLNKRYFKCKANKGLFVRRECIKKLINHKYKPNNPLKLKIKQRKNRNKPRTPKYKLEKEKQRIKSLALIAAENKPMSTMLQIPSKNTKKHYRNYENITIGRIPNELLSDNESIEISSDEAALNVCSIVIQRNLINYGDAEHRDIFMDNYVDNLNDIEYSLSISTAHKNNDGDNNNNYNLIEMQPEIYDIDEEYDYEAENTCFEKGEGEDFPIEGEERRYSVKQNILTRKHLFYLIINRGFIPFFVYGVINALVVSGIYCFFYLFGLQAYWSIDIDINKLFDTNSQTMNHLPWISLTDLLITTILECISILFFIKMLVEKDLQNGYILGLNDAFNMNQGKCFIFCIVKLRNGLKSSKNNKKSCCGQCRRMSISVFMCVTISVIVFFIPTALILCILVNDQFMSLDLIQMILCKALYGGVIAFILSPIITLLLLI